MQLENSITSTGKLGEFFVGVLPTDSTTRWDPPIPKVENSTNNGQRWDFGAIMNMLVDVTRSELLAKQQFSDVDRILSPARDGLRQMNKGLLVKQARDILNVFEDELRNMPTEKLFPLYVFQAEDGSISLEWASPNCRAGINLETDGIESGWHLIVNKIGQEHQEWGYIDSLDVKEIVAYMNGSLC